MKSHTSSPVVILMLILICFAFPLHAQSTIHVDDDAPNDPGPGDTSISDPLEDGTAAHPFDAIQEGIDAAVNGDTVLVADGTYTGPGNREIEYHSKDIILRSMNGPANCIIDGETEPYVAFRFIGFETWDAVLQGFTIERFHHDSAAAAIYINLSCPTIIENVIRDNDCGLGSGGGAMLVLNCWGGKITNNEIRENRGRYGGAIIVLANALGISSPEIVNNLILDNESTSDISGASGAIFCWTDDSIENPCTPLIANNTISGNWTFPGDVGGIYAGPQAEPVVRNCIVYGNTSDTGAQIELNGTGSVTYCDVEGGYPGTGNIDADPLFVSGPGGDHYLSQVAAGQSTTSPCVNASIDAAAASCIAILGSPWCFNESSTRSDTVNDSFQLDLGYHYPALNPHTAIFSCFPNQGALPFNSVFSVELVNELDSAFRQLAGRINVTLANGNAYPNWRAGNLILSPGESYSTGWSQTIPDLPAVTGTNTFIFLVNDVTPAPYNQPPYPASGSTDWAACTIEGTAP